MKTAISIPDNVYDVAEQRADQLGKSRSELYSKAVSSSIKKHRNEKLTEKLNDVYDGEYSKLDPIQLSMHGQSLFKKSVVERGQLWWAELATPTGSETGCKRPVLVIQSDSFNRSKNNTVIVVALTSNMRLINAPGNVKISKAKSGLAKDSANVSQLLTIDKECLAEAIGKLDIVKMREVDAGVRLVLSV